MDPPNDTEMMSRTDPLGLVHSGVPQPWCQMPVVSGKVYRLHHTVNALTTGNPFGGTNLLEVSIGRDFGALHYCKPFWGIRVL